MQTSPYKAKVSPSTIGNILGSRDTCNPETAGKIAKALGFSTDDLFTLDQINYAASELPQLRQQLRATIQKGPAT